MPRYEPSPPPIQTFSPESPALSVDELFQQISQILQSSDGNLSASRATVAAKITLAAWHFACCNQNLNGLESRWAAMRVIPSMLTRNEDTPIIVLTAEQLLAFGQRACTDIVADWETSPRVLQWLARMGGEGERP